MVGVTMIYPIRTNLIQMKMVLMEMGQNVWHISKGVLTGTTASSQKGRWWLLSAAVAAIQLFFKKVYC